MKKRFINYAAVFFLAVFFNGILAMTTYAQIFVHPGGLHTQADLDRMKTQVAAGAHPWIDDWNKLITDSQAQKTYTAAPTANMGSNRQRADADAHAAYLNTIRWYISGDTSYANCAVRICNAWSSTVNQVPTGNNIPGLSGIPIFDMAMVGEILRIYPGWAPADFARFKSMMLNYYYPVCNDFLVNHNGTCISSYWANWDACNIGAILTIGVLCDDTAKFNQAVNYFKSGAGNGSIMNAVYYVHPGNLGQWQESGRDQEHAQLGIGLLGSACQVAWNQGLDLFGYSNNRLLAGAEYVAQTNLSLPVPYQSYNNCAYANQYYLSTNGIGRIDDRPVYELLYNHYVVLQGLSAPNTQKMAQLQRPEHGSADHFGYGTLTFTLNSAASPYPASPIAPAPTGLVATAGVSQVTLNWTTPPGASTQGYNILRSTTSGGPYTSIASWTANTYPQYTDNTVTNGTTYYYVIQANNQSGTSGNSAQVSATPIVGSSTLPTGWSRADIGTVATAGTATYASVGTNTFTVSGSGTDVGGTADSHSFAYTSVTGDFTITARLANVIWASTGYKVGLVMRESLNANSIRLSIHLGETGDRLARFGTRSSTGGNTTWQNGNQYTWVPVWFRLQRAGNVFTASQSPDGVTWFTIGTSTVSMASTYYAGLSVCGGSSTAGVVNTTTFDNVLTVGGGSTLAAPTGLTATAGDAQVPLSWTASTGAASYNVKRATVSGGPYTTIKSVTTTSYTDSTAANGTTYYYVVSAVSALTESTNSSEVSAAPVTAAYSYWPFDETSGTLATDIWNSRVATLASGGTWVSGKFNNGLHLDGTSNGYATLPTGVVSTLNDFTIAGWVKLDAVASWARVFDFGTGTTTYMFLAPKNGSTGYLRYAITTSGGSGEQQINSTTTMTTGTWAHVAVTWSGNVGIMYVNGVEVGRNSSMTLKPSSLGSTTLNYFGRSQYSADPKLTGTLDDFRIYGRALAATEIANLYNIGNQTITFNAIAQKYAGDADFDPAATASSGLAVSYSSSNTAVATIVSGKVHIVATGTATITASQAGNENYTAASTVSQTLNVTTLPTPTGFSAVSGDGLVTLNWTASTDASGYKVKRATVSGGPYTTIATPATAGYYDITAANGTTYYYVVSAVNTSNESANSSEVSATPVSAAFSYWPFDETSGTTATDVWNGHIGTLASGASWTTGVYNNGLHLNGTSNGYTTLGSGLVSTLNDFTVATWVKLDTVMNWARIFDFGSGTNTYMFLSPKNGATGYLRYAITTSGGSGEQQINTTTTMTSGTWAHVAVTWSGNVGILYVNGIEVGRNSAMTLKPSSLGSTTLNYIGRSQYSGDPKLTGTLDDFRIYSRALSSAEVGRLAQTSSSAPVLTSISQKNIGNAGVVSGAKTSPVSAPSNAVSSAPIIAYPNPFGNTLNLNIGKDPVKKVEIQIYALATGQVLYTKQYLNQSGTISLDVSNLRGGSVYLLKLSLDGSETFYKIVKN